MSKFRVVARLDIKGPNLVKGIHLEGLRVLGDPGAFAKYYYDSGIDELFYMDVVASLYERNSLSDLVRNAAKEVFIPLTVGGGLRTLEDIRQVLRAGADKVCINTAAIKNPDFIKEASEVFGSSTIVVAIECIKQKTGQYLAFVDNGREETGVEVLGWAKKVEALGAGEIVLTFVDSEGTGEGLDFSFLKQVCDLVKIPVVAHGGVGRLSDPVSAYKSGASAIAIASVLHYDVIENSKVPSRVDGLEGNDSFIKKNTRFKKINPLTVNQIKEELALSAVPVRKNS